MNKCRSIILPIVFCLILGSAVLSHATTTQLTINEINANEIHESSLQHNAYPINNIETTTISSLIMPPVPVYDESVAIIVENSLYSSVSSAVSQYRQDLNDTGYNTLLYTEFLSSAAELKGNLTSWYETENLIGAVLIGRLPYAEFHHDTAPGFSASTFICDLFLMDLDGVWTDTSPADGIYDGHSEVLYLNDIDPEIFIGRIDPTCLSWSSSVADEVNEYLTQIHEYRTGGAQRAHRALVYIDDDWSGYWGTRWATNVGLEYNTRTIVQYPTTWTNATDWITNRLTQDYQWGHLCAHSSATLHAFGPDGYGAEGIVTSAQIHSLPPSFNFYNLFCCSGAKWTSTDNLAVTYTFSGTYSLASIGSTKTGSMMDCEYFYGPISENATLGESLREWFSQSLNSGSSAGTLYLEWYYGMTIVGDPMLTTYYDCTVLAPIVYSPTHPDGETWYTNRFPQLNWTTPSDVNAIEGYYYIIDQNPSTIPIPAYSNFTTSNGVTLTEALGDGSWFIHVLAKDSVGNIGKDPAHFSLNIDVSPPSSVTLFPSQENIGTDSISLGWIVLDSHSGYSYAQIWLDTETNVIYNGSSLNYRIQSLSEGEHKVNVTVYDKAMNKKSVEYEFFVDITNPIVTIINPTITTLDERSIMLEWSVVDTGSGYQKAEVRIDDNLIGTVNSLSTSLIVEDMNWGIHTLNLTVFDWVNRTDSVEFQIVLQRPLLDILPQIVIIGGVGIVIILIAYYKKR